MRTVNVDANDDDTINRLNEPNDKNEHDDIGSKLVKISPLAVNTGCEAEIGDILDGCRVQLKAKLSELRDHQEIKYQQESSGWEKQQRFSQSMVSNHTDLVTTQPCAQANTTEQDHSDAGHIVDGQLGSMLNLCGKMDENKSLCLCIHDRIKIIHEHVCASDVAPQIQQLKQIVDAFCTFLKALESKHVTICDQLMAQRDVVAKLKVFHQQIDDVTSALTIQETNNWESQWKSNVQNVAKRFRVRVVADHELLGNVKDLNASLKQFQDEMVHCHGQEHLPAIQFVRDAIIERMNCGYGIEISLFDVTDLWVVGQSDTLKDVFVMAQVGSDAQYTNLIKRNSDPIWDANQTFKFMIHRSRQVDLNIQVWSCSQAEKDDISATNDAWPLLELIGEGLISIPPSNAGNFDIPTVSSYPLKVPNTIEKHEGQGKARLQLSHSSGGPMSPTTVGRGCIVCASPVPNWPYCTLCARVFDQRTQSKAMPKWFILRQRIVPETLKHTVRRGMIAKIVSGKLDRVASIEVWHVSLEKTYERDIVIHQIDLWSTFEHPHIIRLVGASHDKDPVLCVCEPAACMNVSDYLTKDSNQKHAWLLLYEVALGLQYLHSQSIVHGSISCENIVIGVDGKTKLCNVGFSCRRIGSSLLHVSTFPKKDRWVAPERINGGDMMEPMVESDIFDFGMTIIEAITGVSSWSYSSIDDIFASFSRKCQVFAWPNDACDNAWKLVTQMCDFNCKKRPAIDTIVIELKNLADLQTENASSMQALENAFAFARHSNHDQVKDNLLESDDINDTVVPMEEDMMHNLSSEMEEMEMMCESVVARLSELAAMWQLIDGRKRNQAALCLSVISDDVRAFLIKYGRMRKTVQLLCGSRLTQTCHRFHSQLDHLLYLCGLEVDHRWESSWNKDNQFRLKAADIMKVQPNCLEFELQDAEAKAEISSLLFHQSIDTMNEDGADQNGLVENELSLVCKTEALLTWLLRSGEIELKANGMFGDITCGYGLHGTWNGVDVVIKVPPNGDEQRHTMLSKEARIWSMLSHPHVLRLIHASREDKQPFVVYESAANGTLSDYLSKENSRAQMWRRIYEAALGLRYVHAAGIVHGDIKSNCIHVGADGKAKIAGFGSSFVSCAKDIIPGEPLVGTSCASVVLGNLTIMREHSAGSFAADIYSFGMCILEFVSGNSTMRIAPATPMQSILPEQNILPSRPASMSDLQWVLVTQMCALKPNARLGIDEVVAKLEEIVFAELDLEWTSIQTVRQDRERRKEEEGLHFP